MSEPCKLTVEACRGCVCRGAGRPRVVTEDPALSQWKSLAVDAVSMEDAVSEVELES